MCEILMATFLVVVAFPLIPLIVIANMCRRRPPRRRADYHTRTRVHIRVHVHTHICIYIYTCTGQIPYYPSTKTVLIIYSLQDFDSAC